MATSARIVRSMVVTMCVVVVVVQMAMQGMPQPLRIVATTGMIGDMASRIVGDRAHIKTLMGEGVDPHLYKVTVSDVRALADADVVIANGLMLEGRMGDVFARLRRRGSLVIEAGATLTDAQRLHAEGSHGHPDPHIWMDPSIWSQCAIHVAEQLGVRDPANAGLYRANARALALEWRSADRAIAQAIATVRTERRVLVTAHDAFAYFGRHYGVEVMGIQGISTESESGLADIRRLIDLLVARNVPAVFVETSVSEKNVLALVEGARARDHAIIIGGSLYSDAMGEQGTPQGTYTGMITANAKSIVHALGGDVAGLTALGGEANAALPAVQPPTKMEMTK
ncbi:MAG: manganese transporter [Phycisphaerales bacterium]|nr:manganese transporter [Phycisphaerales bacterium]